MSEGETNTKPSDNTGAITSAVVAGGVVGGAIAPAATAAAVTSMGFTSSGIAAGTTAAAMMSAEAVAGGGAVAAGGSVATLQSIGAAGLAGGPLAGVACAVVFAGGLVVGGVAALVATHMKPLSHQPQGYKGVKRGKWMVLMEEGWGNVVFYPFETRSEAHAFWDMVARDRPSRPRVLYNPDCHEEAHAGWNPLALPTIRHAHSGPVWKCTAVLRELPPALSPGRTVALYSPLCRVFMRMEGDAVDTNGERVDSGLLPAGWGWERFQVVDAGGGEVAFHSGAHRRFVRMDSNGHVDARGGERDATLPAEWQWERFAVVGCADGLFAFHSRSHNRFLRIDPFDARRVNSFACRDVDSLPDGWNCERFRVVVG